jgi:hypothetical protein
VGTSVKVEAGDDGSTSLTVTGAHWVWNEVAPERRDAGGARSRVADSKPILLGFSRIVSYGANNGLCLFWF